MNTDAKILRLTLKKKWFDMILSGQKKEEYRELKQYWQTRLMHPAGYKHFDFIEFKNGYGKKAPTMFVECKSISTGIPNPDWSMGDAGECFIISLGNVYSNPSLLTTQP